MPTNPLEHVSGPSLGAPDGILACPAVRFWDIGIEIERYWAALKFVPNNYNTANRHIVRDFLTQPRLKRPRPCYRQGAMFTTVPQAPLPSIPHNKTNPISVENPVQLIENMAYYLSP
jgi:hypothetical protein